MAKSPKLRNTLLGTALKVFLGVAAVSFLVFALSLVLKRDLDQVHDRLIALNEEERDLRRAFLTANDLILDLAVIHRGGGPDDAAIAGWRSHLEDLADMREGLFDTSTSPKYAAFEEALIDVEEILAGPLPAEHADKLVARLIPTLRGFSEEVQSALSQVEKSGLQLVREDDHKADFGALAMLCVGFAGFTVVCLLTGRFFLQLSRDVGRLKKRATKIAAGDCGNPLAVKRKDEIGELAHAVNAMARALAERARELENARQRLFQGEKMFALGTFDPS
jgi:HAMP domain-containing protein